VYVFLPVDSYPSRCKWFTAGD